MTINDFVTLCVLGFLTAILFASKTQTKSGERLWHKFLILAIALVVAGLVRWFKVNLWFY